MWDNHEFSWQGWQSIQQAGGPERPGQSIKVAANQAWFEYLPARVAPPSGSLETFGPPTVKDVPIEQWDENGLGLEPNNLAAINSLIGYRSYRYGRHLDLIITDQHSYRSADPFSDKSVASFGPEFASMFPEDATQILDGGRAFNGGNPPNEISFNGAHVPNPRKNAPRKRSSAPPRRPGSRTSCADRLRPGRFGAIPKARRIGAATRRTFRLD